MLTIEIQAERDYGTDISVVVNDECNHAGATEEELDYGYANRYICDWVDDWRWSKVCDKCDWSEIIEPEEPDYDRYE